MFRYWIYRLKRLFRKPMTPDDFSAMIKRHSDRIAANIRANNALFRKLQANNALFRKLQERQKDQ